MTSREQVKERIAKILRIEIDSVGDDVPLTNLVRESFMLVEMAIELQEDFSVRLVQEDLKSIRTVGDLATLIADRSTD